MSWYNQTEGRLYSVSKTTGEVLVVREIDDVKDILAYGSHLQPLPGLCFFFNCSKVLHMINTAFYSAISKES